MSLLLEPYTLRQLTLTNRIVVSPMCQYSAVDGLANDWHLVHLGSRAVGGAGLVFTEACAVTPEGRITPEDLGLWNDAQIAPLQRITRFIVAQGSIPAIQIAHAGRKGSTWRPWVEQQGSISKEQGGWQAVGPSPIGFAPDHAAPAELTLAQIDEVVAAFVATAKRALVAGFKVAEVHAAHGYLIHQFLSPLSNQRSDEYGGSLENRMRLALRVSQAIREVWPQDLPVFVRISATDWVAGGWTADDSVVLARALKDLGIDLIDVSSGGSSPAAKIPVGPGYQTAFAERIKKEVGIPTATVGMITEATQAEHVLRTGQADLVLLARELLRDPYWALNADEKFGERRLNWPAQYARAAHRDTPIHESDLRD